MNRQKTLTINRWTIGMIVTFTAFLCFFLPSEFREGPSQADFADVTAAVTEGMDLTAYPAADQSLIRSKLGLDPAQYPDIAYWRSLNAMDAEELLIIRFDPAQEQDVLDKVNARIQSQKDIYQGYAPEQLDMVNQAVVDVHPNYLFYMTGPQAKAAAARFEEAL